MPQLWKCHLPRAYRIALSSMLVANVDMNGLILRCVSTGPVTKHNHSQGSLDVAPSEDE
jgi:hypothetical protein